LAGCPTIDVETIASAVCDLYRRINFHLREDVIRSLRSAREREESEIAVQILSQLIDNADLSPAEGLPLCQDTGLAVALVRLGSDVAVRGGAMGDAINEGVRRAQKAGPLRASVVSHPLQRQNTGDNTPAVVHIEHVPGNKLEIALLAKGGGAENMSRLYMLSPSEGQDGVVRAAVDTVRQAGANACPPVIMGVGLGGSYDKAPLLARRALLRDVDSRNLDPSLAALEVRIREAVNNLGIGPQGLGGRTTALGVMVEAAPCHIASLPVAVNLSCHSHRHGAVVLTNCARSDKRIPGAP